MKGEFILGDHMDYLKDCPDNFYDLAMVDPQIGIGEDGRKKRSRKVKQLNGKVLKIKSTYQDVRWDDAPPPQTYFDELFRVSRYQIIWCCNYLSFNQKDSSSGRIIWNKVNGNSDFSDCEIAWTNLFGSVRLVEYMWSGMMQGKSIKEGRIQQGNKKLNEKRLQNGQKPVILYRWCLQLKQVKKGWKILDTHVGSASSLVACEIEGFYYVGYEILPHHYFPAKKRLLNHCVQKTFDFQF